LKAQCDTLYNDPKASDAAALKTGIQSLLNSLQTSMSSFNSSVNQQMVSTLDQVAVSLSGVPGMIQTVNDAIVN